MELIVFAALGFLLVIMSFYIATDERNHERELRRLHSKILVLESEIERLERMVKDGL